MMRGIYKIYQYSYEFNDYNEDIPCAVVVAKVTIEVSKDDGSITFEEEQTYDGRLGKTGMEETYSGCLIPKGKNFYSFLKNNKRETPKFVVFYKSYYEMGRLMHTKGYMLTGIYDADYFRSPVYIVRDDNNIVPCNILLPSEISDNIIMELNKDVLVRYAQVTRRLISR